MDGLCRLSLHLDEDKPPTDPMLVFPGLNALDLKVTAPERTEQVLSSN